MPVFHDLLVSNADFFNYAVMLHGDFVEQLHRFNDTQHIAFFDPVANFYIGLAVGFRRGEEHADHR